MSEEQKNAKEQAIKNLTYLYKKYYSQIEEEMKKREELPARRLFFILGLYFISYLMYNRIKNTEVGNNAGESLYLYSC